MEYAAQGRWRRFSFRTRRLVIGSATMIFGRGLSTVMMLGITAVVARSLTSGEFGFWAVLTGLPALAANLDFGIGNALRNRLTVLAVRATRAPFDRLRVSGSIEASSVDQGRICFFSSLTIFFGAALLASALCAVVVPWLPWARILTEDVRHLIPVAVPLVTGTSVAILLWVAFSLGNSGFYAYQEAHWSAFFDFLRTFLTLALTVAAWVLGGKTAAMTGAYFAGVLAASAAGLWFFVRRRRWGWILPTFRQMGESWRELRSASSGFFILQLSSGIIIYTDSLLVVRVAGFASAGDYAVVQKIFMYLIVVQSMVLVPLWGAFTDAHARGDHDWTRRMFLRSVGLTVLVTGAGAAALAASGGVLARWWTGKVIAQAVLFPAMALWTLVYGWSNCFSLLLNSVGRLRRQAGWAFAGAVVNIPLALWWGKRLGSVGVCWAGIASVVPVAISNTLEVRSFLKNHAH